MLEPLRASLRGKTSVNVVHGMGYRSGMGREDREASEQPRPAETGAEAIHGMGLSSEHDEGEIQEVDSREHD
jgi:hypothetical protein